MKSTFTLCTPLPAFIPRPLGIQVLQSHSEIITVNPLVLSHQPTSPPPNAPADEQHAVWYEITERIQLIPGIGKMGSSVIKFPGCFHDMPWGLQTHIHAPMGIDLRVAYRIAGEQYGVEEKEPRELGLAALGAPAEGLYLRADAEVKCSLALSGFVKSQLSGALVTMVERIVRKAERLDASILSQMIEEDKLKRQPTQRPGAGRGRARTFVGATPEIVSPQTLPQQSHYLGVQGAYESAKPFRPRSLYEEYSCRQSSADQPRRRSDTPVQQQPISKGSSVPQQLRMQNEQVQQSQETHKQYVPTPSDSMLSQGRERSQSVEVPYFPPPPGSRSAYTPPQQPKPSSTYPPPQARSPYLGPQTGGDGAYGDGAYQPPRSRSPYTQSESTLDIGINVVPLRTRSPYGPRAEDVRAHSYVAELPGAS